MIRQQRRRELRDAEKSLKKVKKLKEYKEMNEYFNSLLKEDLVLLQDHTHTDTNAQAKYLHHENNMKYLISLESKIELLSKKQDDTGLVKEN